MYLKFVELRRSSAMLLLVADVGLDEGVGDPGPHGAQGSFKVSGLDALGFDVVLQRQEGGLPAHRGYLRQETEIFSCHVLHATATATRGRSRDATLAVSEDASFPCHLASVDQISK